VTYKAAIRKRKFEAVCMFPFVGLGKLCAPFFRLKTYHRVFLFCPSADIGGSIKVNVDLCHCLGYLSPLVIFSKKPKNKAFLHQFEAAGVRTIDLHQWVDHKAYHFINFFFRGVIASWINRVENPIVIGGESLFFYKVLPHVKKNCTTADICHLNTWFNYSQAFIKDIKVRIFSSPQLKRDAESLYRSNHLRDIFYQRLHFIDNKVDIPERPGIFHEKLGVVFVGRGAPQKRVHLIASIAKVMYEKNLNIHFSFVGDVEKVINTGDFPYCTFFGNISDKARMNAIYEESDVLLLASSNEGLPIAVMEMMAYGKVVLSTAVGGIPDYINNGENGFLLQNDPDENKIIEQGVSVLTRLVSDKNLLKSVGANSRKYAEEHFSGKVFCQNYRKVLLGSQEDSSR
jgi:L-malate glycosyltransferase